MRFTAVAVIAALVTVGTLMTPSHAVLNGAGTWGQLQPPVKPSPRDMHGMAFDSLRNEMVVFGGHGGTSNYLNDTWTWDGSTWTKRNPVTSPSRRVVPQMAYDAARKKVVLFGGDPGFNGAYLNDTWTWDGVTWTKMKPAASPPGLAAGGMAYDPVRRVVVLFGGETSPGRTPTGDTWTWNGKTWTKKAPATSPPPRYDVNMAMTWDATRQEVVLFGGRINDPTRPDGRMDADDTWTWNGVNWTKENPTTSPPRRSYHALAYDPVSRRVVLFGGWGDMDPVTNGYLNDTWAWDGAAWSQLHPPTPPAARWGHSMAFRPGTGKLLMFGGNLSDETWTYALGIPAAVSDFDANATTDVAIFRPSTGQWFVRNDAGFPVTYGTTAGDVPVPGDYNGDGTTDVAIFRAGTWLVSNHFTVAFGQAGDVPVPGDYDGDGTTDVAYFRPSTGQWFVRNVAGFPVTFGTTAGDVPVPGDYNGDGKTDVAYFRPSNGRWYVLGFRGYPIAYGTMAGDIPVPGDYNGDGKTDLAYFRPSTGVWSVRRVPGFPVTYGTTAGDVPVPGDYDGDGTTDVAVRRPSTGEWLVKDNTAFPVIHGTEAGDVPLPLPYAIRRVFFPAP